MRRFIICAPPLQLLTTHSSLLLNAQKAHPLVKEDVLFVSYKVPVRAILPSMESRGGNGEENINHYHGNEIWKKVIILLNRSETIGILPLASRLYKVIWGYVTPPVVHNLVYPF